MAAHKTCIGLNCTKYVYVLFGYLLLLFWYFFLFFCLCFVLGCFFETEQEHEVGWMACRKDLGGVGGREEYDENILHKNL